MEKDLDLMKIENKTSELWNALNRKIGRVYNLCVNGLGEVELCKGYTEVVSKGNDDIQKFIEKLLKA